MNLDQLRHLNKEIEILEEQIEKVRSQVLTDVVIGSDTEFPYIERRQYVSGISDDRLRRLEKRLSRRLEELMAAKEEMFQFINSVEDSEMRQILILRYVEGLTWQQIAFRLGRAGDGSTERKKHNRFLELSRVS